ncbi:GTP-binding protein [Ligilactobacillus salivarius]|uniref:GTP-binding protein n=1 Tax=Ligilactobacillus salivarius TaxID=1624 RepID=UPI001898B8BB|nr:TetM/TetW/TetO/TetS family tetracycline resistance ribosomal protection protein [Ligilactobacillus salivarius]
MKHIVTGIIANVDAGKTTLSEALLYQTGNLRNLGRVDNGNTFLDTDQLEKKRGITIFSHQANLEYNDLSLTILDTPGHVDFVTQTEQVLSVLDYAILVISATDGITSHTRSLWNLLKHYHVPVFLFVNKIDISTNKASQILSQLKSELDESIIDFSSDNMIEDIATCDESLFEEYLQINTISDEKILSLISDRVIFPCYFGSALKLDGIDKFLQGFNQWTKKLHYPNNFQAKVFKISHNDKGERLTWLRILGGSLKPREEILPEQKISQIRVYNGEKFSTYPTVNAGQVCTIPGLVNTYPGLSIGENQIDTILTITPVLSYALDLNGNDIQACLKALHELEDEDPKLHVTWSEHLKEISVQIMGEIQLEILEQILLDRYNLNVTFTKGNILYKETITNSIEGVGHFEPLRHYSEVHLLLEPGKRGSGLQFENQCSLEVLNKNWQHQIISNLKSKEHLGVLTGSPLTDVKITLLGGKASNVHTVGGDFRQACSRAVRQGLMMLRENNNCQLLEPWYHFRLKVDRTQIGRAINDIQRMHGTLDEQQVEGILTGIAPVSEMYDYATNVRSYTHGNGTLELEIAGYYPCHNPIDVISQQNYDPVSELENTPQSVFCAHGAGYTVNWKDVPATMHCDYFWDGMN